MSKKKKLQKNFVMDYPLKNDRNWDFILHLLKNQGGGGGGFYFAFFKKFFFLDLIMWGLY